ncbi:hypothetical protein [Nocardia rhizosphaerae]|uniref:ESX-1 secretion-associated protein EspA/EspE-like domain-containing protein n=1 Tax=Nocardia rhizosphaerae TaxID=1691571 RepID=A0ABV8LCK8_9NOCA
MSDQLAPNEALLSPVTDAVADRSGLYTTNSDHYSGITFYEAVTQLNQGLGEGDLLNITSGAAAASLDLLAAGSDPIGYVAGQLFSWMLEHVAPMREVLDGMTGSPMLIAGFSEFWTNVGTETATVRGELSTRVSSGTQNWAGLAAEAYRAQATRLDDLLGSMSEAAQGISTLAEQVGHLIAGIRTAVRDILSGLAGTLVSVVLELSLTAGAATPVVIGQVLTKISWCMSKVARLVDDMDAIVEFSVTWLIAMRDILDGIFKSAAVEQR